MSSPMKQDRRRRALDRLEAQLSRGTKAHAEPLTDADITRIKGEIRVLNGRL